MAHRGAITWLALVAAHALFLWMFLSVAPIESAGAAGVFAADWRHGMAGNSPIYMPGFFAVAIAAWYWTRQQSLKRLALEGAAALAVGTGIAGLAAPSGVAVAAAAFAERFPSVTVHSSALMWRAVAIGVLTDACWVVFVVASRKSLTARSWRPLAVVPLAYGALILARPVSAKALPLEWWPRVMQGDAIAIGSLLAIPVLAAFLVKTARRADDLGSRLPSK